jgi:molecular chaperone DnaJ
VNRNASQEDIKKSFYNLAKKYHPDTPASRENPIAKEKFTSITRAYEILGDEKRRAAYDKYGSTNQFVDPEVVFEQIKKKLWSRFIIHRGCRR